jgi:hypothetical protein
MPARAGLTAHGYYHAAPECWSVYTEVLASEYSNAVLFGQVHQLTVDTYAVQHAGGAHPDKSVAIHLVGLYLVLERGLRPPEIPPRLQQLATNVREWPHFEPPRVSWPLTVFDVAMAGTPLEHAEVVRQWSAAVWREWAFTRDVIARCAIQTALRK